jgi:hypothetical protein
MTFCLRPTWPPGIADAQGDSVRSSKTRKWRRGSLLTLISALDATLAGSNAAQGRIRSNVVCVSLDSVLTLPRPSNLGPLRLRACAFSGDGSSRADKTAQLHAEGAGRPCRQPAASARYQSGGSFGEAEREGTGATAAGRLSQRSRCARLPGIIFKVIEDEAVMEPPRWDNYDFLVFPKARKLVRLNHHRPSVQE